MNQIFTLTLVVMVYFSKACIAQNTCENNIYKAAIENYCINIMSEKGLRNLLSDQAKFGEVIVLGTPLKDETMVVNGVQFHFIQDQDLKSFLKFRNEKSRKIIRLELENLIENYIRFTLICYDGTKKWFKFQVFSYLERPANAGVEMKLKFSCESNKWEFF